MSISQYAIGGLALTAALAVGWAKWNDLGAKVKTSKAETAIAKAECVTDLADDVTQNALQQVTSLTAEVQRQKLIAAAEAKKSRQRLDAYNALARKINNVPNDENVPVPPAVEYVLDAARLRGAVPGGAPADGANEDGGDRQADPVGSGMSTPAPGS